MALDRVKKDWESLGALDPFWAMSGDPKHKSGMADTEEFFRSGAEEIDRIMVTAQRLGYPARRDRALDFGCGLGRMTSGLGRYFAQCVGVDIAENFVAQARALNATATNCSFVINARAGLRIFPDKHFDMIYPRRRLFGALRSLGFRERFLYRQLGLSPNGVTFIPKHDVLGLFHSCGARIIEVQADEDAKSPHRYAMYLATK